MSTALGLLAWRRGKGVGARFKVLGLGRESPLTPHPSPLQPLP